MHVPPYLIRACQKAKWPQHRASCTAEIAHRNRAEERALATPTGDAMKLQSMTRWRDEIWMPFGGSFLDFLYIPDYGTDIPVITIDLQHQPNETELHLQWRPTGFSIPVVQTPCSLNPANARLDWTGAWFTFMQTAPKDAWKYEEDVADHAAAYFAQASDEWRTLEREHWANLNRAEERYFRRRFEERELGYHELTAQTYVLKYDYGEMEGGWIPLVDREELPGAP
ncbi:hypothetical protein RQP46_002424 [Phenoliferia psychrophenolica]